MDVTPCIRPYTTGEFDSPPEISRTPRSRCYGVDGRGYCVNGRGYGVDGRGYGVDGRGCGVDGRGYGADSRGSTWMFASVTNGTLLPLSDLIDSFVNLRLRAPAGAARSTRLRSAARLRDINITPRSGTPAGA
eukprot:7173895-Pyramimonas_sp.AAC.1